MTRSTRPRFQFRPSIDHLDRRVVPGTIIFDPIPVIPCDAGWSTTTTSTGTAWPSPLVINGPSAPI